LDFVFKKRFVLEAVLVWFNGTLNQPENQLVEFEEAFALETRNYQSVGALFQKQSLALAKSA
jgi:hypothetical protein